MSVCLLCVCITLCVGKTAFLWSSGQSFWLQIQRSRFDSRGLSPRANYTDRQPLIGEISANLCGYRGRRMVSAADPYGRILGL
jgi:hypothetical protein